MAALINPNHPGTEFQKKICRLLHAPCACKLMCLQAASEKDFDGASAALPDVKARALVIGSDGFFIDKALAR
jgi:hypothetical protein